MAWVVAASLSATLARAQPAGAPAPETEPELSLEQRVERQEEELKKQRAELEKQKAELAAQLKQLEETRNAIGSGPGVTEAAAEAAGPEAEADALVAELAQEVDATAYEKPQLLNIYGYLDVGFEKFFIPKSSFLHGIVPTRASTFVLGNANVFFDAQVRDAWRGMLELRFTNVPHGNDRTFATGTGGGYARVDRRVLDTTSPNGRNSVLLGAVIIERAWINYSAADEFNIKAGYFFTPWGIWNIDHGTPTLISLVLPDAQVAEMYPLRQTGLQAHGTFLMPPAELGYHLFVSNGRTVGQTDVTENKAFGGRIFYGANTPGLEWKVGASGYYGTYEDFVKRLVSVDPFTVEVDRTVEAEEWAAGLDLSVTLDAFRFRSEGVVHRITYEEGKRPPPFFGNPTTFSPDFYEWDVYALGAYRLPWLGLEPYLWLEFIHRPSFVGDTVILPSAGLNVYFEPEVQLKIQYARTYFVDLDVDEDRTPSDNNFSVLAARLVLAF